MYKDVYDKNLCKIGLGEIELCPCVTINGMRKLLDIQHINIIMDESVNAYKCLILVVKAMIKNDIQICGIHINDSFGYISYRISNQEISEGVIKYDWIDYVKNHIDEIK